MSCCATPLRVDGVCASCGDGYRPIQPPRGGRKRHDELAVPSLPVRPALANVELIELTDADLKYIGRVAGARLRAKLPNTNKLDSVTRIHSEQQLHRLGVTAKYAFTKAFGLAFDATVSKRGDKGFDTTLPDGRTVRIKARDKVGADLILAVNELVADVVVLSEIVTPDVVKQIGWLTRDEFYALCTLQDFGYGQRQIVKRKRLHSMLDLLRPRETVEPTNAQGRLI